MERKSGKVLDPEVNFRKSIHTIPSYAAIFGIFFVTFIVYVSRFYIIHNLPDYKSIQDAKSMPDSFIGERAWHDLKILTSFGPKMTGTYPNEQLAVDFLKREVDYIKQASHKNQELEMDHQIVSGDYYLNLVQHSFANLYRNVQNIVVKLHGETDEHALMLNCHFDSVASSPGANDDGANCVIMMEILRVLSRQEKRTKHSIIFLFNGAEELGLKASHGFITKHKWSKQIRAFINLEACGSGGKEMLFQTGPKHSWLVDFYKKAVERPNAQAAAEEIFQFNLIPSDTDFRIFRDFGHIPGMDFAHIKDAYRYHTMYDDLHFIPPGALQRTGENILNLAKMIANSEELVNANKNSGDYAVFFDFLGLFFVSYSQDIGAIINFVVVLLAIVLPFQSLSRATLNTHTKRIIYESLLSLVGTALGTVLGGLACFWMSYLLDAFDHSMTWYSSTWLAHGLYCTTSLLSQISVFNVLDYWFSNKRNPLSLGLNVQARLNGVNLFWGLIAIGLTLAGYRSGYLMMITLSITLISNVLIFMLGLQNSVHKWLYIHLAGQIFVILANSQLYHLLLDTFIPITGRIGSKTNPDIIVGAICNISTLLLVSYLVPLIHLLRKQVTLYLTLISILLVSVFFAIATHAGFPYRGNENEYPTVQRHYITHVIRTFHDIDGKVRHSDSGFWLLDWDRNAKKTIEGITMPELPMPQAEVKLGDTEVFHGLPAAFPHMLTKFSGYFLYASKPRISDVSTIVLNSKRRINDQTTELSLKFYGNKLGSIFIRPKPKVSLEGWSLDEKVPISEWDDGSFFLMFAQGLDDPNPWIFNVTLKTDSTDYDGPLVDVVANTIRWEYHKEHTELFKKLLLRVPKWAHVTPNVAAVMGYVF